MKTKTKKGGSGSVPRLVVPVTCEHGNTPYGHWIGVPPKVLWQACLPCCCWYAKAKSPLGATRLFRKWIRHNAESSHGGKELES